MARTLSILIAGLCALGQEPKKQELTIEQELAALIDKSNALESFHLVYESSEEGETEAESIELVYRAPDLGHVRFRSTEADVDFWVSGEHVYACMDGRWRSAIASESPAAALLDNLFPPEPTPLGPGVCLLLQLEGDSASDKANFSFSFVLAHRGRSYTLGWLTDMQRRASELFVEGDLMGWDADGIRCLVSRQTGFIERIELSSAEKGRALRLREGHFNESLDSSLVTPPAEAVEAPIDEELTKSMERAFALQKTRRSAFLRVQWQLDNAKRQWNELTRNDWRTFLDAFHREILVAANADPVEKLGKQLDDLAAWVRAQRSRDDSAKRRLEVQERVDELRGKLEQEFGRGEEAYTRSLTAVEHEKAKPRQELFDIELEVVAALWDELIRKPALASFDEKIDAAFE